MISKFKKYVKGTKNKKDELVKEKAKKEDVVKGSRGVAALEFKGIWVSNASFGCCWDVRAVIFIEPKKSVLDDVFLEGTLSVESEEGIQG